jgi:hypothetical protein
MTSLVARPRLTELEFTGNSETKRRPIQGAAVFFYLIILFLFAVVSADQISGPGRVIEGILDVLLDRDHPVRGDD